MIVVHLCRLAAAAAVLCMAGAAASAWLPGRGGPESAPPLPLPLPSPSRSPSPSPSPWHAAPARALPAAEPVRAAVAGRALPQAIDHVESSVRRDWPDADRHDAIGRLAAATGSRVHGLDQLPRDLGRVTLKSAGIDAAAAWRLLLDGAPVGFALTCGARACEVWLARPAAASIEAVATPSLPAWPRVEPTEEQN